MFEALAALGLLSLLFSLCAGVIGIAFELIVVAAITLFWIGAFIACLTVEVSRWLYKQFVWLKKKIDEERESVRISS